MPEHALMSYQLDPVKRILSACPQQKGVLVWHAMGTGKTATGLAFVKTLQQLSCVLCAPRALVDVWYAEGSKFSVNLESLEARKNLTITVYEKDDSQLPDIITYLQKCNHSSLKHTALICDEAHNLIQRINSCNTKVAAAVYQSLQKFKKILLLTGTPMYRDESEFRVLVNVAAGKMVVPNDSMLFEKTYFKTVIWRSVVFGWTLSFLQKFLYQTRDAVNAGLTYDMVKNPDSSLSTKYYTTLASFFQKILISAPLSTAVAVTVPVFLPIIVIGLLRIITSSQSSPIRIMDAAKVADVVAPYVSFYEIPSNALQIDYPKVTFQDKTVDYNAFQLDFWLRLAWGRLTPRELVRLEVYSTVTEANLFGSITQLDVFKTFGRAIGNLHFDSEEAPKFLQISNMIKQGDVQQTVIYSSFDSAGVQLFHSFCKRIGVRSRILRPKFSLKLKSQIQKQFAAKKIQVLILDSSFTEGISLFGARQLHILEPVDNPSKLQQIIARVSRFRSHQHLPQSERTVNVYVWTATANNLKSRLLKFAKSQSLWAKNQPHVGPWSAKSLFRTNLTPDGLIQTRNEILVANSSALSKEISKYHSKHIFAVNCRVAFDEGDKSKALPFCTRFGGS